MNVLLAGASGLIGSALIARLRPDHDCRVLSRSTSGESGGYTWTGLPGSVPAAAVDWADAVISLNGASLGRLPWAAAYRREIVASRVDATTAIAQAIGAATRPPAVWLSASAVGIYGDRGEEELTESSAAGTGFLADVTKAWEDATAPASGKVRVVTLRTGLVISSQGALKPLFVATKLGLGARVGSGRAWWPWVSLDDEVGGILHALNNDAVSGPVNLVGPGQARSNEVTATVARLMRRPYALRIPARVLKTVLGQAADDLLLASQRVTPTKLAATGYVFAHQTIAEAIRPLV